MRRVFAPLLLSALGLSLSGCDQLGIESATVASARREADAKAVGGACRQAGRAIEDCYTLNRRADKAAVFAGWREMNDYMTENKLETVTPVIPLPPTRLARAAATPGADADAEDAAPKTAAPRH